MKYFNLKWLVSVMTAILILGNVGICNANAASLFRILRTVSNTELIRNARIAVDGADLLKIGVALVLSNSDELAITQKVRNVF